MTAPARGEPANPLPAGVRTMWRAETALVALLVLGGALVLASTAGPLMPWLAASAAAAAIAAVVVAAVRLKEITGFLVRVPWPDGGPPGSGGR